MDIEQFYPSVNLGMMKNVLRKHIADYNMLWLLDPIRVLDFCGYRFYRTHTLLRKTIAKRFRRQLNRIAKRLPVKPTLYQCRRVISYLSWTKHANCYNYYQTNLQSRFDINILKGVIRDESKRLQKARGVLLHA